MSAPNDWQDLQTLWQTQKVDLPRLQSQTRWKTRLMTFLVGLEIATIPFVWGITWWMWSQRSPSTLWQVWMLFWCIVTPILTWWNLRMRRGTWRAENNSLMALLQLKRKRVFVVVNMAKQSLRLLIVCALLVVAFDLYAWFTGHLSNRSEDFLLGWLTGTTLAILWLLVWAIGSHFYGKSKHRELEQLDRLLNELQHSDPGQSENTP